ncbi:hypothetical protein EES41_36880 (plasmid) [Streptomyces sp. ADI95-16]|uniref:hypothetical protein n=1 Tax=Streptomyces sp. ADI95-16 TaxID=1522758 RepID=UPI000F3A98D3|nr:hypothetical protein [Streptomyces sp. ADI95-16]AYV32337.1 hypothetical protein EES41_36880 [Streptomyces sp. ADI95-16]
MRRDDVVAIILDSKNEVNKSVEALGHRVNDLDQELRSAFTAEFAALRTGGLATLQTLQQETRSGAHAAAKRAGDVAGTVGDLGKAVDGLRGELDGLREEVREVLALLRTPALVTEADVPTVVTSEAGPPAPAQEALGNEEQVAHAEEAGDGTGPAETDPALDTVPGMAEGALVPDLVSGTDEGTPAGGATTSPAMGASGDDAGEEAAPAAAQSLLEKESMTSTSETREPYPISRAGRIWAIMRAGRIATATYVCHRDAWEFIAAQVGTHPHFRVPELHERDGLVSAVISGRSLVAVLLTLYRVAEAPLLGEGVDELVAYADWAMACQLYQATAVALANTAAVEGEQLVITVDNRIPAVR